MAKKLAFSIWSGKNFSNIFLVVSVQCRKPYKLKQGLTLLIILRYFVFFKYKSSCTFSSHTKSVTVSYLNICRTSLDTNNSSICNRFFCVHWMFLPDALFVLLHFHFFRMSSPLRSKFRKFTILITYLICLLFHISSSFIVRKTFLSTFLSEKT